MLDRLFTAMTQRSPTARGILWKWWYNFLGGRYRQDDWTFMNYGYSPGNGEEPISLRPEDEPDRYCIQLYDQLARRGALAGKKVVEVGCGRGGGCSYVHRYHRPKATRGLDFSKEAVALCRRRHRVPGLSFREGDAGALPLRDGSVDVVMNVESSHCYPDRAKFFREVVRVLKPGGLFLYTDFYTHEEKRAVERHLAAAGLEVVEDAEITKNVVAALERDHARKKREIERILGGGLSGIFAQFAGLKGSKIHRAFKKRELVYWRYVMKKKG